MKRGTDHVWEIRKYKGDISLYAHCKCGFKYPCSHNTIGEDGTPSLKQEVEARWLFQYCPHCGARKKRYTDSVKKVDRFRWE